MSSMKDLELATRDYNQADSEYKSLLFKHSLLLLSAELAIIGFLLQNNVTQILLHMFSLRIAFLASIICAASSISGSIMHKRSQRSYEKHYMHSLQYAALTKNNIIEVFGQNVEINGDFSDKQKVTIKKAIQHDKIAVKLLKLAELTFILSAIFGIIFIFILLLNI